MPPSAAAPGRMRRGQLDSSPSISSRLTSSPTSRKNTAISPSLIQCSSDRPANFHMQGMGIGFGQRRIGDDDRQRRRRHQHIAAGGFRLQEVADRGDGAGAEHR